MPSNDHGAGRVPTSGQAIPLSTSLPDDLARARLRRNRALASGMLAGMLAIFVATKMTPDPGFATLLIQSASEAGLVGGLADWFAVTALFRQPLGLPIPHTAIIPNNKERIGRTLGRFVERNFLTQEAVLMRLKRAHVGQRLASWLTAAETAATISGVVSTVLPYIIRSLRSRDMRDFVQRTAGEQLRQADIAPIIGRTMRILASSGEADALFEHAIRIAVRWIEDNRGRIDALISERSPWWVPRAIDRRIATAIFQGLLELFDGLQQADSETRAKFRQALDQFIDELLTSSERREQINAAKNRFLTHPTVQAWLASSWTEISYAVLHDLAEPASRVRIALDKAVLLIGQTLHADARMQRHIDRIVEDLAQSLIAWRGEIGSFVADVIRGWDTPTLSNRLELVVGSDLQYIRMNGTIVGACAGCVIFLTTRLFG